MSSYLPYVIPGSVVPGPFIKMQKKGLTGSPLEFDPIADDQQQQAQQVHPDVVEKKAAEAKSRLGDEDLMSAIKKAITQPSVQVQPSNLDWRT